MNSSPEKPTYHLRTDIKVFEIFGTFIVYDKYHQIMGWPICMGESFQDYSTESHPQNAELRRLY